MTKPRALQPGDTIALVCPASPIAEDKVAAHTGLLEGSGYRVRIMPHALDSADYLAGSDEDRAADLQEAFLDPAIQGILCGRGGYGCARLLPHLDLDMMAASRKVFGGFSDITTLHAALNRRGLSTLHAPMALTLHYPRAPWVSESLLAALRGDDPIHPDASLGRTVVPGIAQGPVVGGCLCLITDSIGTPEEVPFDDALLLIEDVDEAPHRIDAMLTHLLNSGRAERVAGFVVGEMTRTDERVDGGIGGRPWESIFTERLTPLGKPMIFGYPFGHCPQMLTLPLGATARLDANQGSLTYVEAWCE